MSCHTEEYMLTFDKQMASVPTGFAWMAIFINLVKNVINVFAKCKIYKHKLV